MAVRLPLTCRLELIPVEPERVRMSRVKAPCRVALRLALLALAMLALTSAADAGRSPDTGGEHTTTIPTATEVQLAQARGRGQGRRPRDQNDARDAVRGGQARPLGEIIGSVQRYCPGRFLDAQLSQRGRSLIYHVRMLTASGHRVTIAVDAQSGAVVGGNCR